MKLEAVTGIAAPTADLPRKGKAVDAAKQFEALLIGQMLKTMREGGSGWLGSGEDQASESAMGMAEEHFAAALSASGGLGLANTVERGLTAAPHSPNKGAESNEAQKSGPQKLHE